MTIFQKQYFKEISLITGGLGFACDYSWGRRKKTPTRGRTGRDCTVFMRKDQLFVCREEEGIDDIYRRLIWVRKFNTQTASA